MYTSHGKILSVTLVSSSSMKNRLILFFFNSFSPTSTKLLCLKLVKFNVWFVWTGTLRAKNYHLYGMYCVMHCVASLHSHGNSLEQLFCNGSPLIAEIVLPMS